MWRPSCHYDRLLMGVGKFQAPKSWRDAIVRSKTHIKWIHLPISGSQENNNFPWTVTILLVCVLYIYKYTHIIVLYHTYSMAIHYLQKNLCCFDLISIDV